VKDQIYNKKIENNSMIEANQGHLEIKEENSLEEEAEATKEMRKVASRLKE